MEKLPNAETADLLTHNSSCGDNSKFDIFDASHQTKMKQAEDNYKDTTSGGVKGTFLVGVLDELFRATEHKTLTMERSEHR